MLQRVSEECSVIANFSLQNFFPEMNQKKGLRNLIEVGTSEVKGALRADENPFGVLAGWVGDENLVPVNQEWYEVRIEGKQPYWVLKVTPNQTLKRCFPNKPWLRFGENPDGKEYRKGLQKAC